MALKIAARGRPAIISDDELLDVARAVFLERGLDATTADVAERARVSTSLIFYRYKTKEALFAAVLEREMSLQPFFETLPKRVGKGRVEDTLFDAGMAILSALKTVLPLSMMAWSSTKLSATMHEKMKHHPDRERMNRLLQGYFAAEMDAGCLTEHEPNVMASAFIGGVIDYVLNHYLSHGTAPAREASDFLRQLIALIIDGCAPKTTGRGRRGRR